MVTLVSKDNQKGLLIALDEEDKKTLYFLFDSHIVFGMYQITSMENMNSEHPNYPQYQKILVKFPSCVAVAHININSTFVPRNA